VIALTGSLAADAILVAIGTHLFPSTAGYSHFRFDDYAKLTIIGVLVGAAGWPVLTHISSAPRWLYGRLTVLISLALFLPDAWLLVRGQPPEAVAVLMTMHVAIALVIYCTMVFVAPIRIVPRR
jgi:FtsH-binding integral membrane protein